ncbi:MAG TPA: hypothetical protein DEP72_06995 [Clostridiales bacterium]|nr:MAG: hypothetical protein A2Y18_07900 [Clostridiales bacterium GWD2_32_19]HCC07887.1 hypothetical protein [Clostridiales bacterium]
MKEFLLREQSRILTLIHRLMYIISFFTSSFLLIYFLKLTNWDLKIISMHYIASYASLIIGFFLVGMVIKNNNIFKIYRLGILTQIIYLSVIMYMATEIRSYIVILGVIKGLSEALYWVPRHYMIYKMNKSKAANKFFCIDQTISKIQDIILPVLMGGLIAYTTQGYTVLLAIMILILTIAFMVSSWLDLGEEEIEPLKIHKLKSFVRSENISKIKKMYLSDFFHGVATGGVLMQVVTMLIYIVYKSEFGLGVYSSVLALIIAIITFLMGQYVKDDKFEKILKILCILTVVVMLGLVYKVNDITLILYSVITGISFSIINIIGNANLVKLIRKDNVKEYTLEHIMLRETAIGVGRIVGYTVLYNIGSLSNNINSLKMMLLFLTICITMRVVEIIFSLKERDEHTIHALSILKLNMRAFKFYLKKQI